MPYRILCTVYHISHTLERFSKLDCSTIKRAPIPNVPPIPNETSSERSQRYVSNAYLFGTDTTNRIYITWETNLRRETRGSG